MIVVQVELEREQIKDARIYVERSTIGLLRKSVIALARGLPVPANVLDQILQFETYSGNLDARASAIVDITPEPSPFGFTVAELADSCAFSTFNSMCKKVSRFPNGDALFSYIIGSSADYLTQYGVYDIRKPDLSLRSRFNVTYSANAPSVACTAAGDVWIGYQSLGANIIWASRFPGGNLGSGSSFSYAATGHGKFAAAWDETAQRFYVFGGAGVPLLRFSAQGAVDANTAFPGIVPEYTGVMANSDGGIDLVATIASYDPIRYPGSWYEHWQSGNVFPIIAEYNAFVTDFLREGDALHSLFWTSPQYPAFGNPDTFNVGYRRHSLATGSLVKEHRPLLIDGSPIVAGGSAGAILTRRGGSLYAIFGERNKLIALRSEDDGNTWTTFSTKTLNAPTGHTIYSINGGAGDSTRIYGEFTLLPFTPEQWAQMPTGVGVAAKTYGFYLEAPE